MEQYINTQLINDYLTQNKMSKTSFCKKAKISNQSLYRVLDDNLNIDIKILFKIAWAMDLHIKELFTK